MSDKRQLKLAPNKASACFVMREDGPTTHLSSMAWDVACAVQYTGWMMEAYTAFGTEEYFAVRQALMWATEGGWWPAGKEK